MGSINGCVILATIKTFADLIVENAEQLNDPGIAILGDNVLIQQDLLTAHSSVMYHEETQPLIEYTRQSLKFRIPLDQLVPDKGFGLMLISKIHDDDMVLFGEGVMAYGSVNGDFLVDVDFGHATIRMDTGEVTSFTEIDSQSGVTFATDEWLEFVVEFNPSEEFIGFQMEYEPGNALEGQTDISNQVYDMVGFCGIRWDGDEEEMLIYLDEWIIENLDDEPRP